MSRDGVFGRFRSEDVGEPKVKALIQWTCEEASGKSKENWHWSEKKIGSHTTKFSSRTKYLKESRRKEKRMETREEVK